MSKVILCPTDRVHENLSKCCSASASTKEVKVLVEGKADTNANAALHLVNISKVKVFLTGK